MEKLISIQWRSLELQLNSDGTMWLPNEKTWVVSDVHFGKITHFRKHGISLPFGATGENLNRIESGIQRWNPEKVVFTGDLFHSSANSELEILRGLFKRYSHVEYILTAGNHDRFTTEAIGRIGCTVVEQYRLNNAIFEHENSGEPGSVSGHIHPVTEVKGKARQRLRLKSFIVHPDYIILPSFGYFTGGYNYSLSGKEKAYLIAGEQLFEHPRNAQVTPSDPS